MRLPKSKPKRPAKTTASSALSESQGQTDPDPAIGLRRVRHDILRNPLEHSRKLREEHLREREVIALEALTAPPITRGRNEEEPPDHREARGALCKQVVDEIKRIWHMSRLGGRTTVEIERDHPDYAVWKLVSSLSNEDRETFAHPNTWGPRVGYARMLLGKHFGNSPDTVRDWVKEYQRNRKPIRRSK